MKYQELGYSTLEAYETAFYDSLMPSNTTKDYFVNWKKVFKQVNELLPEIYLLNSLIKIPKNEKEIKLQEILKTYPKTRSVIPLILIVKDQVSLLKVNELATEFYSVNFSKSEPKEIVRFCKDVGILELLENVKDLHDYLVGVGVGRDSNARKNRSGEIFSSILEKFFVANNIKVVKEDPNFEFTDPETKRKKRPDFVIYKNDKPKLLLEVNFYNSTGSKPIEIVESYIKLQQDLSKEKEINFVWITDGPAWLKMKKGLNVGFKEIDYLFNYQLTKKHLLNLVRKVLA